MTKIIRYVTGFPKDITPVPEQFEDARRLYNLNRESAGVFNYSGLPTIDDFNILEEIFHSDQFKDRKNLPESFFVRLKHATSGKWPLTISREVRYSGDQKKQGLYLEKRSITGVSQNLLDELKRITNERGNLPTDSEEARKFILEYAKENGLYNPVSFFYPYGGIEDLVSDRKVLVFVDEKLGGEINLTDIREYSEHCLGNVESGKVKIIVDNKQEEICWTSYLTNLRAYIDPVIRKKVLNENEGVNFIVG